MILYIDQAGCLPAAHSAATATPPQHQEAVAAQSGGRDFEARLTSLEARVVGVSKEEQIESLKAELRRAHERLEAQMVQHTQQISGLVDQLQSNEDRYQAQQATILTVLQGI